MAKISEKELEDYIFENYNSIKGLSGNYIARQLNLKGYGILDLLIVKVEKDSLLFKIVELKQGKINCDAVNQVCRYIQALRYSLEEQGLEEYVDYDIEPYLIGSELSQDVCYLTDILDSINLEVITYKLDLENGVTFDDDNGGWYPKKRKKIDFSKIIKKAKINYKENEQE